MKMKFLNKVINFCKDFILKKYLTDKNILPLRWVLIGAGVSVAGILIFFNFSSLIQVESGWQGKIQRADRLYREKKLKKASEIYLEVRENFPSNPRINWVNYRLGNIFQKSGLLHRALFFYEKIEDKKTSYYSDVQFNRAQCYRQTGRFGKAIEIARMIIREFPKNDNLSEVYIIMADSLLNNSQEEKAISIYRKLIEGYPGSSASARAYFQLGNIHFRKKRYSEAILFYSRLIEDYSESEIQEKALYYIVRCYLANKSVNKALSTLHLLGSRYPGSSFFTEGLFRLGKILLSEGKISRARELFNKIIKTYRGENSFLMKVKKGLAETYLAEKQIEKGIELYQQLLAYYPLSRREDLYFALGALYLRAGQYKQARQVLQKFVHYYPLSSRISTAYYNLGKAFLEQSLYFKAIPIFKKALRQVSSKEEKERLFSKMIEVYIKTGLWNKAIKTLKKKISLSDKGKSENDRIKLLHCYLKKKDIVSAEKILSSVLQDFSGRGTTDLLNIAHSLYRIGEKKLAFKIYKVVRGSVQPQDKEWLMALYNLADFREDEQDFDSAVESYRRILDLTGKDHWQEKNLRKKTLLNLSDLYYELGEYQEASKFYLQLREEFPGNPYTSWCLYQLGNCYRHLNSPQKTQEFYNHLKEDFPKNLWTTLSRVML